MWTRKLEFEVVELDFGFDVGKSECGIVANRLGSARLVLVRGSWIIKFGPRFVLLFYINPSMIDLQL